MTEATQRGKAEAFLHLHTDPKLLVLPNAWDVASARLFAAAGFPAVGTTSMGISGALGHPDVQVVPLDTMLAAAGCICRGVDVPVTVDFEAGYADEPREVGANALRVVAEGAVGINLEDGTGDPRAPLADVARVCDKIRAIREATADGVPLVVNARCDVYLAQVGSAPERFATALERGRAYRAAGADCIFVPGLVEPAAIGTLVRELDAPLNVLANPTVADGLPPTPDELEALGVARLSVGSAPMKVALAHTLRVARELAAGSYRPLRDDAALARTAYGIAIDAD